MGFGWQEIDKTLDLGFIRVAGLHRECKPAVVFDPSNFRPRTMTNWVLFLGYKIRGFVVGKGATKYVLTKVSITASFNILVTWATIFLP